MANTYTAELQLVKPTPADPLSQNSWGTLLNTSFDLIDSAVAGQLTLSVAGGSNVTLTSSQGAADQERNQHFVFTGALTGSIVVLYPTGRTKQFSVLNSTSGNFTLGIGVSNGSGGAVGTTVSVPQGYSASLVSDGTNVAIRDNPISAAGGDLSGTYVAPVVARLQGRAVSSTAPSDGQILTWIAGNSDWEPSTASVGVASITDAANGGLNFSASTGTVTAQIMPSDLATKAAPTTSDSFVIMDAAATNQAKTSTGPQVTAALAVMVGDSGSGGTKGLAPAPASGDAAAGKFLKANGTWATPPSNGTTFIAVFSASGGVIDTGHSVFSATYDNYLILMQGIQLSSNAGLQMQVYVSGSLDSGSNYWAEEITYNSNGGGTASGDDRGGSFFDISNSGTITATGTDPHSVCGGAFEIQDVNGSNYKTANWRNSFLQPGGVRQTVLATAMYQSNGVIQGVKVIPSTGSITAGKLSVFGYAKS